MPTDRTGWLAYVTSLPLILSATALGLHWPGAVFADEDDAPTPLTLGTEQITATRGSRLAHDVAAAVTVVDQSEIEVAMPQVLSEALRGRVGKFFQQTTHGASTSASPSTCGSNWVNGQQSTVNSQWSMVNGQRDTVNGEQRTANSEQRTVNSEQKSWHRSCHFLSSIIVIPVRPVFPVEVIPRQRLTEIPSAFSHQSSA